MQKSSFSFDKITSKQITHMSSHGNLLVTKLKKRCIKLKSIDISIFSFRTVCGFMFCSFPFFYFIIYVSSISNQTLITLNISTKNPLKDLTRILD